MATVPTRSTRGTHCTRSVTHVATQGSCGYSRRLLFDVHACNNRIVRTVARVLATAAGNCGRGFVSDLAKVVSSVGEASQSDFKKL